MNGRDDGFSRDERGEVTHATFVQMLLAEVPELHAIVSEHFAENDELLLHLLMADILRFVVAAFRDGRRELCARCLAFVGRALVTGDEAVNNAVCVSFVEDIGVYPDETPDFIANWPLSLLEEKRRQDAWRRDLHSP